MPEIRDQLMTLVTLMTMDIGQIQSRVEGGTVIGMRLAVMYNAYWCQLL